MSHNIYEISGRVKNLIAMEDMALAPNGLHLVNLYSLFLKQLYDFSDTLPGPHNVLLQEILCSHESLPKNLMMLSKPKEEKMSLFDQLMQAKAQFGSTEEAYEHFKFEYEALGQKYGMSGDDFWMESEEADGHFTYKAPDYEAIRSVRRSLSMCQYLLNKANSSE